MIGGNQGVALESRSKKRKVAKTLLLNESEVLEESAETARDYTASDQFFGWAGGIAIKTSGSGTRFGESRLELLKK